MPDMGTLQNTEWFFLSLSHLAMHHYCILVLNREIEFLSLFIYCNAVRPVRGVQRAIRADVPSRVPRKDRQCIESVIVYGVNITSFGIDIESAVELHFGFVAANDP